MSTRKEVLRNSWLRRMKARAAAGCNAWHCICAGNSVGCMLPGKAADITCGLVWQMRRNPQYVASKAARKNTWQVLAMIIGQAPQACVHVQELSYDTPFARTDTFSPQLEDLMNCCIQCACSLRTCLRAAHALSTVSAVE